MFIRTTKRTYKGKTYTNHLLVESVHTAKGPRQRTVCSLGDLSPRSREEWLKLAHKVEEALLGQCDLLDEAGGEVRAIVAKVKAGRAARDSAPGREHAGRAGLGAKVEVLVDRVETRDCREAGTVHVGYAFWKRLGLDGILADFEGLEGFEEVFREPSPTNPFQKKSTVRVKLKRHEGETYVLCLSSERVEKDRAIREKQEGRLLADLAKLQARIAGGRLANALKIGEAIGRLKERYPRVARYYEMHYDGDTKQFTWAAIPEKLQKARELDGSYLLRTDREDLSADEA